MKVFEPSLVITCFEEGGCGKGYSFIAMRSKVQRNSEEVCLFDEA